MAVPQMPMRWMCLGCMIDGGNCWFEGAKSWRFAGEVEFGLDAEREGDVGAGYVAGAKANGDGGVEISEDVEDDVCDEVGVGAGGDAVEHLAEDETAHAFEFSGEQQVAEHAIDLVGLRTDVFEEKQLAFGARRVGRAERGGEQAQAASVERAAGVTCAEDADSLLRSG